MGKRSKSSGWSSRKKRKTNREKKEKEVGKSSNQDQVRVSDDSAEGYKHEVFLSFFGKDTRMNITDHLYRRLKDLRIETFRDSDKLYVGENIEDKLTEAIKTSKIMMPIFSKNYAWSEWCLREVTHMVECVKKTKETTMMYPIFYDVTPSEVRNQTGSFKKAFAQHEKKFDIGEVEKWREALREVPKDKGWERSKTGKGYDEDLIQAIATKLQMELKKMHVKVREHLVGMDQHETELMSLLDLDCEDVKIVGIVGMGGIGKTTIAKFIYNKLCDRFSQRCSFVENVREKIKQPGGLDTLKNKLMSDILKRPLDGVQMDQKTFKGVKALIVLDDADYDVGKESQLKEIIGNCNWFGCGSRIIVTTRNKHTFKEPDGEGAKIFEPEVMNSENALSLFCKHAFRQDFPLKGYEDLSKEIVSKVAGLPLSLEVIGSLLATKEEKVWHEKLKDLGEKMDRPIQEILQVSYDMLADGHQQIFLDIACHFIGSEMDKRLAASYMWGDCTFSPVSGIDTLVNLSLVKIDENGGFKMHDQLRDLGREIVRKENPDNPGDRSRLWSPEEALEVLVNKRGTGRVKTLTLCGGTFRSLSNEMFKGLSGLRYLGLSHTPNLTGDFKDLFSNLRWFRWLTPPIEEIKNFCLPKLVVLDLRGSFISDGWEDLIQIKGATNLKVLDLTRCYNLTKTPDLSSFSKLERLNLQGCSYLAEISPSIRHLENLNYLNLEGCTNLAKISPSIEHLNHLNYLNLKYCNKCCEEVLDNTSYESKFKLPEFVWKLKSLAELSMESLKVTELSEAIGNLTNLSILHVGHTSIKKFPNAIGTLKNLERLDASECISLEALPKSVGNLRSLRWLSITCSRVKILPSDIGTMEKLENLDASGCQSLEELPESVGKLRSLKRLCINNSSVKRLPSSIRSLKKLEELDVSGCQSLEELPESVGDLQSLRWLSINNSRVKSLPSSIGSLEKLLVIGANDCILLEELPESIVNLRSLICLRIANSGVKSLPSAIESLEKLEVLDASECLSLEKLPESVGKLKSLRLLHIKKSGVKRLPIEIGTLEKLEEICARDCKSLEELPESVGKLQSLRWLCITCSRVKSLPSDIGMMEKLENLDASGCQSLEELPESVGNLQSLRRLCIKNSSVKRLPSSIGSLKKLEELDVSGCQSLEELPESVGDLQSLRWLSINNSRVKSLPSSIGSLEKLEQLDASGCQSLEELPESVGNLRSLIYLHIENSGVKRLPIEIQELKKLTVIDGNELPESPDFSLVPQIQFELEG